MNLSKVMKLRYWIYNRTEYLEKIEYDKKLYLSWSKKEKFAKGELKKVEWKYLILFRKTQANSANIWGKICRRKLKRMTDKTGIWIPENIQCGNGLIIAHWGRIIVNPRTIIGDDFSISSGAVIGRDIRGKRQGTPVIGNRVCVKTNAAIIGNIVIGDDVLIAPNAFVNFDVPSHSVVVGNPGKIYHRDNATEGYIGNVM